MEEQESAQYLLIDRKFIMNDAYLDKAQEILELKLDGMISDNDIADAIEDIVEKYPDQKDTALFVYYGNFSRLMSGS